jgi:lipopolysaccharide biosynthesis glycosyltransferase
MNILLAPNNYYVMPTVVLLQSLFETAQEPLDIYMIHSDLTQENIRKLDDFITVRGGAFHELQIDDSIFDQAHTSIHITKQAYYRLLAQRVLPETVEKILYLDGDLVVNRSLKGLYDMSFMGDDGNEKYFIVCEGPGVSRREWSVYDNLGIPHEYAYFNSGVLLMNIRLLRDTFDPQILLDFIRDKGSNLKYHDQDTLNALFYDKVIYADWHIYNQTVLHIQDKVEAAKRLENAAIIHYAGSDKPWKHDYKSYYFSLFWQFARRAGYRKQYVQLMCRRFCWKMNNRLGKGGKR